MSKWVIILAASVLVSAAPKPAAPASAENRQLVAIERDVEERDRRLNPMSAIAHGDMRNADRIGDFFTDARVERRTSDLRTELTELHELNRAALSPLQRIVYDTLLYRTRLGLRMVAPPIVRIEAALPLNPVDGLHLRYPLFASGEEGAPFGTVADYESNLHRNADYARALDRAVTGFKRGIADGIVMSKDETARLISQFDRLIGQPANQSSFLAPLARFPAAFAQPDRDRLTAAYQAQLSDVILPAERRVRDFLASEYLPQARTSPGLSSMRGGAAYYQLAIERATSRPWTAAQVDHVGQVEMERILAAMERQRQVLGFRGTVPQLIAAMRADPRFKPRSSDEVRQRFEALRSTIEAHVGTQFSVFPATPLVLRPIPEAYAPAAPLGGYAPGGGGRPGTFFYNTSDLPSRYTWLMDDVFLHEGIPGHHYQLDLAAESGLPSFMHDGSAFAFEEGWGMYAESLWSEMGVEQDPYARMGGLASEMARAMRLVVDTGLHARGWSRQRAIDFLLTYAPISRADAEHEVDRYIANPGQALSYTIGELAFLNLKRQAQRRLGARFDPRRFHAALLDSGSLPLPVLNRKMRDWESRQ